MTRSVVSAGVGVNEEVSTEVIELACIVTVPPIERVVFCKEQFGLVMSSEDNRFLDDTAELCHRSVADVLTGSSGDGDVLEGRVDDVITGRPCNQVRYSGFDALCFDDTEEQFIRGLIYRRIFECPEFASCERRTIECRQVERQTEGVVLICANEGTIDLHIEGLACVGS